MKWRELLIVIVLIGGIIMPRGQADFGMYAPKEVTASISDMGEIAARLGGIGIYDKRGDVVDFDNFEEPIIKWNIALVGGEVYLWDTDVKSGSQALALVTTANTGDAVYVTKHLSVSPSKRVGFEISIGGVLAGLFWVWVVYYDGEYDYEAYAYIDFDNHLLYVQDGDLDAYVLVGDTGRFHYSGGSHFFYNFKLVCDFDTGKFVRIMLGAKEWDISTINIKKTLNPAAAFAEFQIGRENTDDNVRATAVDDFIFTQAEP